MVRSAQLDVPVELLPMQFRYGLISGSSFAVLYFMGQTGRHSLKSINWVHVFCRILVIQDLYFSEVLAFSGFLPAPDKRSVIHKNADCKRVSYCYCSPANALLQYTSSTLQTYIRTKEQFGLFVLALADVYDFAFKVDISQLDWHIQIERIMISRI